VVYTVLILETTVLSRVIVYVLRITPPVSGLTLCLYVGPTCQWALENIMKIKIDACHGPLGFELAQVRVDCTLAHTNSPTQLDPLNGLSTNTFIPGVPPAPTCYSFDH
jgi:hypothetical protein